jgi:hypothetical protein
MVATTRTIAEAHCWVRAFLVSFGYTVALDVPNMDDPAASCILRQALLTTKIDSRGDVQDGPSRAKRGSCEVPFALISRMIDVNIFSLAAS